MARDNQTLINLCKLYRGGENNPYNPERVEQSEWANEYLKFHVWDAEFAFISNYSEWLDMWQRTENKSEENEPNSVYNFVINCKLGKMQRDDIDFWEMYHNL